MKFIKQNKVELFILSILLLAIIGGILNPSNNAVWSNWFMKVRLD